MAALMLGQQVRHSMILLSLIVLWDFLAIFSCLKKCLKYFNQSGQQNAPPECLAN